MAESEQSFCRCMVAEMSFGRLVIATYFGRRVDNLFPSIPAIYFLISSPDGGASAFYKKTLACLFRTSFRLTSVGVSELYRYA